MQEQEERKKQKLLEIHDRIESKRQERLQRKIQDNIKIKEVLNRKPLYQQIEEKYVTEVQIPEREKYREELLNRKQYYKPINRQEINEHSLEFERKMFQIQ